MLDLQRDELASISKDDKVVSKYMEELERINKDPKFIHFMSEEEDRRKLENTMKRREREIGMEEGREEGITLGSDKKAKEIALNLYQKGVDIDIILSSTSLSREELDEILKNH